MLIDENNKYVFDNYHKANLLNEYFASVCIADNNIIPECHRVFKSDELSEIEFTSADILKYLNKLKPTLSAGPDGLPRLFFKKLAPMSC